MSSLSVKLAASGVSGYSVFWRDDSFISNGISYGDMGDTSRINQWVINFTGPGTLTANGGRSSSPLQTGHDIFFSIVSGNNVLAKGRGSVSFTFTTSATVSVVATVEAVPVVVSFNASPGTVSETSRSYVVGQKYGTTANPLPNPSSPPAEYGTMIFDGWYFGQTKIDSNSVVSVPYDHTLRAKWSGGTPGMLPAVDAYDDSMMVEQIMDDVEPVRRFGLQGSCRKTFPSTPEGLTPFTGFTNYQQGIPAQYEFADGILPDLSPATEGKDYSAETGYRALLQDINAIGEIATREQYFRQCGGIRTFSKTVSDAIGGYPAGAMLEYWDGEHLRTVCSLIDDNTFNFAENSALIDDVNWTYADIYSQINMPVFLDTTNAQSVLVPSDSFEQDIIYRTTLYVSDWFTVPYDCCLIVQAENSGELFVSDNDNGPSLSIGAQLRNADGSLVSSGESFVNVSSENFSVGADSIFGIFAVGKKETYEWYGIYGNFTRTFYMKAGSSIRLVNDLHYSRNFVMRYTYIPLTSRLATGYSTQVTSSASSFAFAMPTSFGASASPSSTSPATQSNLPLTYNGDFYLPVGYNGGGIQIYRKLTSAYNAEFGVNSLDLSDTVYRWNGSAFVPTGD